MPGRQLTARDLQAVYCGLEALYHAVSGACSGFEAHSTASMPAHMGEGTLGFALWRSHDTSARGGIVKEPAEVAS